MEPEWNLSVCGLNCATCDFMRAGQGDKAKQKEIIDWFKRDFDEEITPEETMCMGCRGPRETHWSPDCALRNCAIERGVTSCYMCEDFICSKLDAFSNDGHSSHKQAVDNLREIKKTGYTAWLKTRS